MKAMILAAGLGTRLRPLTNDRPKALVTVAGRTLLEITLARLRSVGATEVVVNVHHFADKMIEYLEANHNFGMQVEISREEVLLDTGGGLKKAAAFFLTSDSTSNEPFILHNVDVISTIDLRRMLAFHQQHGALATLAVQNRETSRYLLFDETGQLCGRRAGKKAGNESAEPEMVRHAQELHARAFAGIHILSPALLPKITEEGIFSIIPTYLRLAAQGEKILAFHADEYYWRDLGRPEHLEQAARDLDSGVISIP